MNTQQSTEPFWQAHFIQIVFLGPWLSALAGLAVFMITYVIWTLMP